MQDEETEAQNGDLLSVRKLLSDKVGMEGQTADHAKMGHFGINVISN